MNAAPQPQKATPNTAQSFQKLILDLLFTLAIPVTLLSPDLFKTGFNFADAIGTVAAYVLAGLIPALYIIVDTLRTRTINPVTILAASSALVGGFLAFLRVDGWVFALKDSYASIVIALVMAGSLILGKPFFGLILNVLLMPDTPEKQSALTRLINSPTVRSTIFWATVIILVEATLLGILNFAVNFNLVVDAFGTKAFNAQVAKANTFMRPISMFSTFIAYGLAYYAVQWGTERDFGEKAKLFEDHLWEALTPVQTNEAPEKTVSGQQALES